MRITRLEFKAANSRTLYYLEANGLTYHFHEGRISIDVPAYFTKTELLNLISGLTEKDTDVIEEYDDGHTEIDQFTDFGVLKKLI